MDLEAIRNYCLDKEAVSEGFPFGEDTLVFKVNDKIFALLSLGDPSQTRMNLKCDPDRALILRDRYEFVRPGYHMNKKHWNTVLLDHPIPDRLLREWIDHSYELIRKKTTKKTSGRRSN